MTSTKLSTYLLPLSAWGFLATPLCAATVTMTGATNSLWTTPATWSDNLAPAAANDYTVGALTLNAPTLADTATATFSGKSLAVTGGGISFPGSSGGTHVQTYSFPSLTGPVALTDSTLAFSSNNSTTKSVGAALSFSGSNTIGYASSSFTHNLTFAQPLTGSGTLTFNWTGGASTRNVNVNGTGNTYAGGVVLNSASGTANFNLTQPLGAPTYEVHSSWRLNNNVASGLAAATAIGVFDSGSLLNLAQPWNNAAGVLTVQNGNVTFGSATSFSTSSIASLVHDGGVLQFDVGSGTADKLALSGNFSSNNGFIDVYLKSDPGTQTYDLITYGGTLTGTPAPALVTPSRLVPNFSNGDGSNDKVTVSFTGTTANLVWKGDDITSPNNWDTDATSNFDNAGTPDRFLTIDSVTFNDSAASFTPSLIGTVIPKAVTFNNATNAYTLGGTGAIGGTTTLAKSGAADLTITAANTYTGGTTLNAGKIRIGNNAALGTGTLTVNGGAITSDGATARTLALPLLVNGPLTIADAIDTGAMTFSSGATLATNFTLTVPTGSGVANNLNGVITDGANSFSITKDGVGSINFNSANTYDGGTAINAGRLAASNIGALGTGAVTVAAGAGAYFSAAGTIQNNFTLAGNGWTEGSGALGALRLGGGNSASGAITLASDARITAYSSTGTLAGNISQTGGARKLELGGTSLAATGGTITVSGNNSHSGGTDVRNATVVANSSTAFGSGAVVLNGAIFNARIQLGNGVNIANALTTEANVGASGRGILEVTGTNSATWSGPITFSTGVTAGGHLYADANATLTLTGGITAPGEVVHRLGTVVLSGGGSYPAYQLTGTLKLGGNNGVATNANLKLGVSAASIFNLNGYNQTLAQLTRTANTNSVLNNGATPSVLTIDNTVDHTLTNSTLANGTGGLSLVKKGSGTFTLGAASTYTGTTSVEGGKLVVNGSTGATPVTVAAAGTLGGTGPFAGTVSVAGTIAPGNSAGTLTTTNTVTFGPGSSYAWEIADWTGAAGTGWDLLNAATLDFTATPANKLTIVISGTAANFTETAKSFKIAGSTNPITGFNPAAIQIDDSAFVGAGTWSVQLNGNTIELVYAAGSANPFATWASANGVPANPALDSDGDGIANGIEFVIGGNPAPGAGSDSHALLPTISTDAQYLNFTYRRTDEAAGMPQAQQPYVQYGSDLTGWVTADGGVGGVIISEVNGTPDLVTVKIPRSLAGNSKLFARLRVDIE